MAPTRYRNVVFTLFTTKDEWKAILENAWSTNAFTYIIGQLEKAPGTGNFHIQGYCELEKQMTLQAVKQALGSDQVHIEKRRGSQKQAIDYCKKEESREEEPVIFGEPKGQGRRNYCCDYCEWFKELDDDEHRFFARCAFGSIRGERCDNVREATGFYSGGVFRNVREVQPGNNDSVQYPYGERFSQLAEISDELADIEDMAVSSSSQTQRAERSSDIMGFRPTW